MDAWSRRQFAQALAATMGAVLAPRVAAQEGETMPASEAVRRALGAARAHAALNAFVALREEAALAEAAAIDRRVRAGGRPGPLAGMVLAIKDNIDVAGLATTACTPALRDNRAERDAPVVAALGAADGIVLGKAGLHELAFGSTCVNPVYGTIHNPWNPALIPGGSSGGTAVAIAAGIATGGLGSDTAGSVRMPASLCGIVGFRPSLGRYPAGGLVPLSHTRDVVGPMAATVEDVAALDAVLAGAHGQEGPKRPSDLVLALPEAPHWLDLHPDTEAAARAAIARIEAAGVRVRRIRLPDLFAVAAAAGPPTLLGEMIPGLRAYLATRPAPIGIEALIDQIALPELKAVWTQALAAETLFAYFGGIAVRQHRPVLQQALAGALSQAGAAALVFPTTPAPALAVGGSDRWRAEAVDYTRNMEPGAAAGWCGISLPTGRTGQSPPVGLALEMPPGSDKRLLAIARTIERILQAPN